MTSPDKPLDALGRIIVSMVNAMEADYPEKFRWTFADTERLRQFKRRLYERLRALPASVILDAYDQVATDNPKNMPTIPEIAAAAAGLAEAERRAAQAQQDANRGAQLPGERISPEGLRKIAETREKARQRARMPPEEYRAITAQHDAIIQTAVMSGRVRTVPAADHHKCAVSYCDRAGTIGSGTSGGGNWYCSEHYRGNA